MRSATTVICVLVAAGAAVAQPTDPSYPYGYWNVNITRAKTSDGWIKNLTLYYFDDAHDVIQKDTAIHCSSQWNGATLTEVKHCDDWTLDLCINGGSEVSSINLAQLITWGKGKFVTSRTVSGSIKGLLLNCPRVDGGKDLDCIGFVRVNATDFKF